MSKNNSKSIQEKSKLCGKGTHYDKDTNSCILDK